MFSHYWITIPDILEAISVVMLHIGAAEFLSAQVPQFMKGILIGITYCSLYISGALWFVLFKSFTFKNFWGTNCHGQLWILVFRYISNNRNLHLSLANNPHKVAQEEKKTRCATKRTYLC